ncbi:hypothetical protein EG339_17465 [Chryseobacterium bernardetii]|uniref:Uncharacterized protein n=1 Tax=Chryseobacterium bernardetii TaxID=1241978 RepID=A0A3G6TJI1_9FLAO|nr:hypothetical protein EG339_17465 [Chryseobacterium bernardetii]
MGAVGIFRKFIPHLSTWKYFCTGLIFIFFHKFFGDFGNAIYNLKYSRQNELPIILKIVVELRQWILKKLFLKASIVFFHKKIHVAFGLSATWM